ncbi:MAG: NCS2 family permease [Spirochaetes bacterium]|nr:NCS2 family permease [Spirochaetota bacterium]
MVKIFGLKEKGTNLKTEILAGITTFMTMAYILAVNPSILSNAGMNSGSVFTATCISSAIATLFMALYAKLPVALAPGMGLNAFFAFTVVIGMGYSWQLALTAVFLEGIFFILLSLINFRESIIKSIPIEIKKAAACGIGLFIAYIGLKNSGIVTFILPKDGNVFNIVQTIGDISNGPALLTIIGLVITIILITIKIKGALLLGIIITTLIGIPLKLTVINSDFKFFSIPAPPLFFNFEFNKIFTLDFFVVFFTFLFVDVFDTVGTLSGLASEAGLMDKNGNIYNVKKALLSDAIGTTVGAIFGTSTVTSYIESAAGIAEGGKTGLTSLTVAILFFISLFLSPLFLIIPPSATAPALIIVGFFMISSIKEINFNDYEVGIPAFLTLLMMPLTYSIAEGLIFGIISYVLIKLIKGKYKEISPVTLIISIVFLLKHLL